MPVPFALAALAALGLGGAAGFVKRKGEIKQEADELERRAFLGMLSSAVTAGRPEALRSPEVVRLAKKHGYGDILNPAAALAGSPLPGIIASILAAQGGGGLGQPIPGAAAVRPEGQPIVLPPGPLGVPGAAPALPEVAAPQVPAVREEEIAPVLARPLPITERGRRITPPAPTPTAPLFAPPGAARAETVAPAGIRLAKREPEATTPVERFLRDPTGLAIFMGLNSDDQSRVMRDVLTKTGNENLSLEQQIQLVSALSQRGTLPPGVTARVGRQGTSFEVGPPTQPIATSNELNATLEELFGTGAAEQPTPERIAAAQALIRERQARQAGRTRLETEFAEREAALDRPLNPTEAGQLIQPGTFRSAAAVGIKTAREAQSKGFVQATPQQLQEISATEDTGRLLETLDVLSESVITSRTRQQALFRAPGAFARGFAGVGQEGLYVSNRLAYLGNLSRNLGGERGVLTNVDIQRMAAVFPGFLNTAQERTAMFGVIKLLHESALEGKRRILAGEDPTVVRKQIRPKIEGFLRQMNAPAKAPTRTERAARLKREAPSLTQEQIADIIAQEEVSLGGQ